MFCILCYDCIDFCFAHSVLCTFGRMFVLYFTFSCFHYACLRFPPSSSLLPAFVRLFICLLQIDVLPSRGLSVVYLCACRLCVQKLYTCLFIILGTVRVCTGVFGYRFARIL
jgi:hypothetical protein